MRLISTILTVNASSRFGIQPRTYVVLLKTSPIIWFVCVLWLQTCVHRHTSSRGKQQQHARCWNSTDSTTFGIYLLFLLSSPYLSSAQWTNSGQSPNGYKIRSFSKGDRTWWMSILSVSYYNLGFMLSLSKLSYQWQHFTFIFIYQFTILKVCSRSSICCLRNLPQTIRICTTLN